MEEKYEWVEVNPGIWKPEKQGDSVSGKYVGKKEKVGVNESTLYYLEQTNGIQTGVWSSTVLENRMQFINVGDIIKITFTGTQENKRGQPTKIFKVEKARGA